MGAFVRVDVLGHFAVRGRRQHELQAAESDCSAVDNREAGIAQHVNHGVHVDVAMSMDVGEETTLLNEDPH
jgi:hypothetical protein